MAHNRSADRLASLTISRRNERAHAPRCRRCSRQHGQGSRPAVVASIAARPTRCFPRRRQDRARAGQVSVTRLPQRHRSHDRGCVPRPVRDRMERSVEGVHQERATSDARGHASRVDCLVPSRSGTLIAVGLRSGVVSASRPRIGRRWLVAGLVVVAVLVVAAVFVRFVVLRDSTHSVPTNEALKVFRAQSTTSTQPESTTPTTAVATSIAAATSTTRRAARCAASRRTRDLPIQDDRQRADRRPRRNEPRLSSRDHAHRCCRRLRRSRSLGRIARTTRRVGVVLVARRHRLGSPRRAVPRVLQPTRRRGSVMRSEGADRADSRVRVGGATATFVHAGR